MRAPLLTFLSHIFFIFFLVENQCSRGKCYFLREIFPQKACFVFIKVVTLQSFRAASAV